MVLKLLPNGQWRNTETGRYSKAPIQNSTGRWIDPYTKRFVKAEIEPVPKPAKTLPKKSPAPAVVEAGAKRILTGEEFLKLYGNLPPLEAGTEAASFHRGVANMAIEHQASIELQRKIRKMDKDKLLQLYYDNPSFFGESGYFTEDWHEDMVDLLVKKYESKYGVIK